MLRQLQLTWRRRRRRSGALGRRGFVGWSGCGSLTRQWNNARCRYGTRCARAPADEQKDDHTKETYKFNATEAMRHGSHTIRQGGPVRMKKSEKFAGVSLLPAFALLSRRLLIVSEPSRVSFFDECCSLILRVPRAQRISAISGPIPSTLLDLLDFECDRPLLCIQRQTAGISRQSLGPSRAVLVYPTTAKWEIQFRPVRKFCRCDQTTYAQRLHLQRDGPSEFCVYRRHAARRARRLHRRLPFEPCTAVADLEPHHHDNPPLD